MIDQRTSLIIFSLSAAFIIAACLVGNDLSTELSLFERRSSSSMDSTESERLTLIDSAVHSLPDRNVFEYTGGFENPFKALNRAPKFGKNNRQSVGKTPRIRLFLKGILIKTQPLAILENGMGETAIRGMGEKAFEQLIVSISDNHVTLRDQLGTYDLTVEEP